MKSYPRLLLLVIAGIISCQKKQKEPATQTNNPTPVTPTPIAPDFTISGHNNCAPVYFYVNRKSFSSISWDFGDGSPVLYTGPGTFSHSYSVGTYTVTMILDDDSAHIVTKQLVIKPSYSFSFADVTVANDSVSFQSSTCPGSVNVYAWTFGDGTTSTLANPVHTYTTEGTYDVIMEVNGDKDHKVVKNIHILKDPGYTRNVAGARMFHDCQRVVHTVDNGNITTYYGDMTVTITYVNGVTLTALGATYTYNQDKSTGSLVYYRGYQPGGGVPGDDEPAFIIYDYVKDSISIKQTDPGTLHGSTPGSIWGAVFTCWWK